MIWVRAAALAVLTLLTLFAVTGMAPAAVWAQVGGSPGGTPAGGPPASPFLAPLPGPAGGTTLTAEAVLNLAVSGSHSVNYEGTQSVVVRGQRGTVTGTLHVARGDGDRLLIQVQTGGGATGWVLQQQGTQRAAMSPNGSPATRGQAALTSDIEPQSDVHQMLAKYRVVLDGAVSMLDHPAWVLRILRDRDARLAEQWTVDATTGLLLARKVFDTAGQVERSIAFTAVREPYTPPAADLVPAATPAPSAATAQQWVAAGQLGAFAASVHLPSSLPDGYTLRSATTFRVGRAGIAQLVFSDGLEEVSLFQQPGRLGRRSLPPGAAAVALNQGTGYSWSGFPRGVAWQAGPDTDTLVGASPADELQDMANALPQAPLPRSLRDRAHHLLGWVLDRMGL
ncbi:MAG TPA: sigma-E factor regulatory protein RseB domain-containing protein [Actinomycetota bacterium]|nr:sigma-E factor regulatory protein RseB domain-containing protein [Actinomycetota bacterium]